MNTPELHNLIARIKARPIPSYGEGYTADVLDDLLVRALPHLERFAKLELMHHAESDCYYLSVGVDPGDGLAVWVTENAEAVEAFFANEAHDEYHDPIDDPDALI